MGWSPNALEGMRKACFLRFTNKRFKLRFYGLDWKYDKKLLAETEPFVLERLGVRLKATPVRIKKNRRKGWGDSLFFSLYGSGKLKAPIMESGVCEVVLLVDARTQEAVYACNPGTAISPTEFNLASAVLLSPGDLIIDSFQISMEV